MKPKARDIRGSTINNGDLQLQDPLACHGEF
jgi:hypothetical protein